MSLILTSLNVKRKHFYLCKNIRFYIISSEFRQNGYIPMKYFNCAQISISSLASSTLKRLGEHKVTANKQNCGSDVSYWPFCLKLKVVPCYVCWSFYMLFTLRRSEFI